MRLTPRKDEVERVVAILEDDGYADAAQMAKALIKEIADLLWMRDWYAAVHHTTSTDVSTGAGTEAGNGSQAQGVNWAPFASPTQARTTMARTGIGGHITIVKLHSPGMLLANLDGKPGWPGFCATPGCGHAPHTHNTARGASRGACVLTTCPCTRFRKEAPPQP